METGMTLRELGDVAHLQDPGHLGAVEREVAVPTPDAVLQHVALAALPLLERERHTMQAPATVPADRVPGVDHGEESPELGRAASRGVGETAAWRWGPLAVVGFALLAHLWGARPAQFAYYMSFNEWWYSGVLLGELQDVVMPPGLVATASLLNVFGPVPALRLVSLLSFALLVLIVFLQRGARQAVLVATLPWAVLWAGRGQTDMAMTGLAFGGLLLLERPARPMASVLGGGMLGLAAFFKPVAWLAVAPALFTRGFRSWQGILGFTAGSLPAVGWALIRDPAVWAFHADRGALFGNTALNLVGALVGLGAIVVLLARRDLVVRGWPLVASLAFGAFALAKAPFVHEYYLLPALVALCLGDVRRAPLRVPAVNAALGVFLLWWTRWGPSNAGGVA